MSQSYLWLVRPSRNDAMIRLSFINFILLWHFCHAESESPFRTWHRKKKYCTSQKNWIRSFCQESGHEFYVEVPISFINDPVVSSLMCDTYPCPYVREAFKLIVDSDLDDDFQSEDIIVQIEQTSRSLYNLLHAKYIATFEGLTAIKEKCEQGVFGQCPRVYCRGHFLFPVGMHDKEKKSSVKCFCAKCRDIYHPTIVRHRNIDSCAFGTTLPHLLLQRFPELAPSKPVDAYVPRIYGFRIHESARELQIYRNESKQN